MIYDNKCIGIFQQHSSFLKYINMKKLALSFCIVALLAALSSCFTPMPRPVTGGGTLPPQGGNVIFYLDFKYTGTAKAFSAGNYGPTNLGSFTENISSIYIPASLSVKVTDRSGRSQIFTNSVSDLQQQGWDNKIYSVTVIKGGGGFQGGNR
jgi:hypothetical protein